MLPQEPGGGRPWNAASMTVRLMLKVTVRKLHA